MHMYLYIRLPQVLRVTQVFPDASVRNCSELALLGKVRTLSPVLVFKGPRNWIPLQRRHVGTWHRVPFPRENRPRKLALLT